MVLSLKPLLRTLTVGAVSVSLALLSACTPSEADPTESPSASVSASSSPSPTVTIEPSANLDGITVSDEDVPQVTVPAPWAIGSTQSTVLREGGPQLLDDDSVITIRYAGYNGRTGEQFDGNFDQDQPLTFPIGMFVPGFTSSLVGKAVGSRVLMGIAADDGYPDGQPAAGIEPGDSLVFVVDIVAANFSEATGEPVAPEKGLPSVTMNDDGPQLSISKDDKAPSKLKVATLIKGPGAEVTKDSSVQVRFRTWNYDGAKLIEDAWSQPQTGAVSELIEGWIKGIPGQTAGSRVLLVVPPDLAYPNGRKEKDGNPAIAAGQTLVYVVDILDVQNL